MVLSRTDLLTALDGHADPVASWLRDQAQDDASVAPDPTMLVDAVGASLGCSDDRRSTFVVLSDDLRPRGIVAHCSDDAAAASQVLTVFEPHPDAGDLDSEHLRMAAWDEQVGRYRRYQFAPHPDGGLGVMVEPAYCSGCHGFGDVAWAPIMSEMTSPWARWNAEPDFDSMLFEDDAVRPYEGPLYGWLVERLNSASRLEPIVRASIARITNAKIIRRGESLNLDAADSLLRPVFCDDRVNFVSESHGSGELDASAVLDVMIGRDLQRLGLTSGTLYAEDLKLPATTDDSQAIQLLAVRAELSVEAESALVARAVLSPLQSLRVRALDWQHPVGSALRCDLYERGLEALANQPGALDGLADVDATVSRLYASAMLPVLEALGVDDSSVVAIQDASTVDTSTAQWAVSHVIGLEAWEAQLRAYRAEHESEAGRVRLGAAVLDRACLAPLLDPTRPAIPGFDPGRCAAN